MAWHFQDFLVQAGPAPWSLVSVTASFLRREGAGSREPNDDRAIFSAVDSRPDYSRKLTGHRAVRPGFDFGAFFFFIARRNLPGSPQSFILSPDLKVDPGTTKGENA